MFITVSELIQKSISLYRDNAKLFIQYTAINLLPWTIVGLTRHMILTPILTIIAIIVSLWSSVAQNRVMAKRYRGEQALSIEQELSASTPHIWPLIGSGILGGLAILVGTLLFIIPGIIVGVWFAFTEQAVAIDGAKSIEALTESKRIVDGRWWSIVWRIIATGFVFTLPIIICNFIVSGISNSIVSVSSAASITFIITALTAFIAFGINVIFTPLLQAARVILYLEGKKNIMPTVQTEMPAQHM